MGEGPVGVGEGEHGLGGDGDRVVDGGADARVGQGHGEGVSLRGAHGELVVDVARGQALLWQGQRHPREKLSIARGDPTARLVPVLEPPELHAEEGGLELVQPARVAELDVLVPARRSMIPQPAYLPGHLLAGGQDHTPVAAASEVLGGIEGQARDVAPGSR